jgi:predicted NUDIX family NTP pyrophosphohydrolase
MKQSAGILLYKIQEGELKVFLVHPGGPFFIKKNEGWWTIPKGELLPGEDPLDAAIREFKEETGYEPAGDFILLKPITQKGGKQVLCWAVSGDLDPSSLISNTFKIQWPPQSGKIKSFPEVDKADWFTITDAKRMINERQASFLDELNSKLI